MLLCLFSTTVMFCLDTGDDDTLYVCSECGLFPVPIAKHMKPSALFQIKSKFQFVGKFLAKALVDSRMVRSLILCRYFWLIVKCSLHCWCYRIIPYSFNDVADLRNVQRIHIEIEMKW